MAGGQTSNVTAVNATPFDGIITACSAAGGGPITSPWGKIFLTPPVTMLPYTTADMYGMAVYSGTCPNSPGLQLWFQSLDVEAGILTNGWSDVIR